MAEPSSSGAPVGIQKARMLYDFAARNDKELSCCVGDVIIVKNQLKSGWGIGELRGEVGLFPLNHAELLPLEIPQEASFKVDLKKVSPMIAKLQEQCGFFEQKRSAADQRQTEMSAAIASLQESLAQSLQTGASSATISAANQAAANPPSHS